MYLRGQRSRKDALIKQRKRRSKQRQQRTLQLEGLEQRQLLAVGPQLFAVRPDQGALLQDGDTLNAAPREVNLLFKGGANIKSSTIAGNVVLTRAGHDGTFDDGNEVTVDLGFVGLADANNLNRIVLRPASFSTLNTDRPESSLPDDTYRLHIDGSTSTPLTNTADEPFNDGQDFDLDFTLDLGAQVVAVVPQPIARIASGLVQNRDEIVVYFNNDDLDPGDATNPAFYRLVDTAATASETDNTLLLPTSVSYNATSNTAVLDFSGTGIPDGTYRLDIGETIEPNDSPTDALRVGTLFSGNTYTRNSFLGDSGGSSSALDDEDWYRLNLAQTGDVTVTVTPKGGDFDPIIEIYQSNGTTLFAQRNANAEGQLEQFTANNVPAGDFFVRILGDTGNANHRASGYLLEVSASPGLAISDANSSFRTATDLGVLGVGGQSLNSQIEPQSLALPQFPGSVDEPGHRDIQGQQHISDDVVAGHELDPTETPDAITVVRYYFGDLYGTDSFGNNLSNQITEGQKERVREIFDIYSSQLGIEFVEVTSGNINDLQVVVGSIPAVTNATLDGVFGRTKRLDHVVALMDATQFRGDDKYGGAWFQEAVRQIGKAVAFDVTPWLVSSYDLVSAQGPGVTVGPNSSRWPGDPDYTGPAGEPVFPGDHDLVHHRREKRPDATDIDLYQVHVETAGVFTAEITAQRTNSLLNSVLTLFDGEGRVVSQNDDYFSKDSYLELKLDPGTYYVGVTSTGNSAYDPTIADSGFGGVTDGVYQLDLGFAPGNASNLRDTTGVAFDGDVDGNPGGVFQFWFESSSDTIYVDKANDQRAGIFDGDGSLDGPANDPTRGPYDNLQFALSQAATRIVAPAPADLADGDKFELSDDTNTVAFEFNKVGGLPANGVDLTAATSADDVAAAIQSAVNAAITGGQLSGITVTRDGNVVQFRDAERLDISQSAGLQATPNVVRIVGNGGIDGSLGTLGDNLPYLLGRDNSNFATEDGAEFLVPQSTTVMIDAGALFKMRRANLDAGSSAVGVDRSGGAIQVLGTPDLPVFFRSLRDDTVGGDSDGVGPAPIAGDYGGIVFREDSDLEDSGVFLNWVNHADIERGGGKVPVQLGEEVFTPIHMIQARPTISHNKITRSAGAALSGDPNSFSDEGGRLGPDIHSNTLIGVTSSDPEIDNSVNGLFIRIETQGGQPVDKLTVSARFDDIDIPHVITENLHIAGNAGGSLDGVARLSGRLHIDPGMIIKLDDTRIEAERGASNLIAEGTDNKPIIFTSVKDDRFGGSGTFNTDGGLSTARQGDWGGLIFNAVSKASIDHALITFAGGQTPIEGDFAVFNAIEVHQADLRLTNSILENNASGRATGDRNGRGTNTDAVIFVRGAQPILVDNIIRNNNLDRLGNPALTNAISINANALNSEVLRDYGRSTGAANQFVAFGDNHGPLVRLNKLANNGRNGMEVRGAYLTTETIWDDTDIVHVVHDEIMVGNHHTFSGLRLQSSNTQSLVVKFADTDAGFTASGRGLDIDDRIGGSLHIVGTIGHPVVLTSIADDTVGAGFTPEGSFQSNTDNRVATPQPGNWRSVLLKEFSNDRNVAIVNELEDPFTDANETNLNTATAEPLGELAPNLKSGDENRRLGFEVHGIISPDDPADQDVYSFQGTGGTRVWIDLDRTATALDATVELLNINGEVLASSIDNNTLTGSAETMRQNTLLGEDYYSLNRMDAGMSLLLPGSGLGTYFVRVRSNGPTIRDNATRSVMFHANGTAADTITVTNGDFLAAGFQPGQRLIVRGSANNNGQYQIASVAAGTLTLTSTNRLVDENAPTGTRVRANLTSGEYQLQIRLQQRDEKAGSSVRFADIRYARTGIQVQGLPAHSPLLGESGEPVGGDVSGTAGSAFNVGNLLTSDRAALSLSGTIGAETDVDWFQFTVDHDLMENAPGNSSDFKTVGLVFDLDYADGLSRPDTTIAIFNESNELIYIGRESNITDDRPTGAGNAPDDLSRGSAGVLDPYIGPIHLPVGFTNGNSETYRVAVMSNRNIPLAIAGFFLSGGAGASIQNLENLRLEPANGVQRIVEDHIGRSNSNSGGYTSGTPLFDTISSIENRFESILGTSTPRSREIFPDTPRIFFTETAAALTSNVVPFRLDDVRLYVSTEDDLFSIDPLNGNNRVDVGDAPDELEDIVFRTDGRLYGYRNQDVDNIEGDGDFSNELGDVAGALVEIDASNGNILSTTNDNIRGPVLNRLQPVVPGNYRHDVTYTDQVDALTFRRDAPDDPLPDAPRYDVFYSVRDPQAGVSKLFLDDNSVDDTDVADGQIQAPPAGNDTDDNGRLVGYIGAVKGFAQTSIPGTATADPVIGFFPHAVGPASNGITLRIIQSPVDPGGGNPVVLVQVVGNTITATIRHNNGGNNVSAQALVDAINDELDDRIGLAAVMDGDGGARVSDNPPATPPFFAGNHTLVTFGGSRTLQGFTTGLAFVDGNGDGDTSDSSDNLYGVTDRGEFFRIDNISVSDTFLPTANVTILNTLPGVEFQGLSVGPQNMRDLSGNTPGFYSQMLFAVDRGGTLRAFSTGGAQQNIFNAGASSVNLGVSGSITGLAFSPLDFNLWHPTHKRGLDNGHGIQNSVDHERRPGLQRGSFGPNQSTDANGNQSLYFALEQFDDNITAGEYKYQTYSDSGNGSTAQLGILSNLAHNDLTFTNAIGENYNLPGGALGSMVTGTFSLSGYAANDKPTLYFNYFLETENAAGGPFEDPFLSTYSRQMRDSARVFISNDGVNWDLLVTNNSTLSREEKDGDDEAELSTFISHNATANLTEFPNSNQGGRTLNEQQVQEMFDNTGIWRQARVDLHAYAGLNNLRLRFDFSTAGSMDENLPGDRFGMFDDSDNNTTNQFEERERGQNNAFEGFYIDDIIVGLTERGEMVTGAVNQTAIFDLEQDSRTDFPDPTAPRRHLTGDYQLEIRRATEYASLISSKEENIVMKGGSSAYSSVESFPFHTNDRFILETGPSNSRQDIGDRNVDRQQGQILIDSNIITHSANYGIEVAAGPRSVAGNVPQPGSAIRFDSPNTDELYPGAVLQNNVIAFVGQGGIRFGGDIRSPNNAPVPFGRIVNNTIYNGDTRAGNGITIEAGASPTILNNVFANTTEAIFSRSNETVVIGSNLFHNNFSPTQPSDATAGSNPLFQGANDPLLVDPGKRNFYLKAGSLAIDSSLNTLADRSTFASFKSQLGIPQSNMKAPDLDVFGQTRVDDPTADPLGGGSSIFKDRGAVDRADDEQPFAELILPVDNDVEGLDLDANETVVRLESNFLNQFAIFLGDGPGPNSPFQGTGVNPLTVDDPSDPNVSRRSVKVSQNGVQLVEDVDYTLGYSANNNVLLLTPLSGLWEPDSVYVIDLDNNQIKDLAGNRLRRNQPSGATKFTILLGDIDLDFGDAPDFDYGTLLNNDGARHVVVRGTDLFLGSGVDVEPDGQPVVRADGRNHADGDDADQTIDVSGSGLSLTTLSPAIIQLPLVGSIANGESFTIDPDGSAGPEPAVQFQFDLDGDDNLSLPIVSIDFFATDNIVSLAERLASAISNSAAAVGVATHLGGGAVHIAGGPALTVDLSSAPSLSVSDRLPVGLQVPGASSPVQDGDTFVIRDGNSSSVTFEFEDPSVTAGLTNAAHVAVNFAGGAGYNPDTIAASIAAAITAQVSSGALLDLTATASGSLVTVSGSSLDVEDDEDGVTFSNQFVTGAALNSVWQVDAQVTGTGKLDAWVDFNQNGTFSDAEKLPLNGVDSASVDVVDGLNTFRFDVGLITAVTVREGLTYARFRLSTTGGLLPKGLAVGGEVEDHEIRILSNAAPFVANSFASLLSTNPSDLVGSTLTQDVDDDGTLDATDTNADGVMNIDEDALHDAVAPGVDFRIDLENVNGKRVFDDVDISNGNGDFLTYTLVSNSNTQLVTATLNGARLDLDFANNKNGSASIVVRATDQAGLTVEDTLSISVNAVNDAPAVVVPVAQMLDEGTNTGPLNNITITGISVGDLDLAETPNAEMVVTLGIPAGTGMLAVDDAVTGGVPASDITGNGTNLVLLTGSPALLVATLAAGVTYTVPNGDFNSVAFGSDVILTVTANDQGNTGDEANPPGSLETSATVAITVNPVNDAPVVTSGSIVDLGTTDEETALGRAVSFITADLAGRGLLFDVDVPPDARGIAITGVTGKGTWHYSIGGGAFQALNPANLSDTAAVLLSDADTLRYTPDAKNGESAPNNPSVVFRAWDQTTGAPGDTVDVLVNGDTTAFSSSVASATTTVTAVNDAPEFLSTGGPQIPASVHEDMTAADSPQIPISSFIAGTIRDVDLPPDSLGIALLGFSGNGQWRYSINGGGTFNTLDALSPPLGSTQTLLLRGSDLLQYLPDGENGEVATVTYLAWDQTAHSAGNRIDVTSGTGGSSSISLFGFRDNTAALTVQDRNDPPVAVDDPAAAVASQYSITEDQLLSISDPASGLIDPNDFDVDNGDSLFVVEFDNVSQKGAIVSVSPDGSFSYDPRLARGVQQLADGDNDTDTFTYTIADLAGERSTATVTVSLAGVNDPPQAVNDPDAILGNQAAFRTNEKTILTIPKSEVLRNDIDDAGDTIDVVGVSNAATTRGTVSFDGTNITYNPTGGPFVSLPQGAFDTDVFLYTIEDQNGTPSVATVTIRVDGVNDPPVAGNDVNSTRADQVQSIPAPGVLGGDTDPDTGFILSARAETVTSSLGATVTISASGAYVYDGRQSLALRQLRPGQSAQDTFSYRLFDEFGLESIVPGTVSVSVIGVNDPPEAKDDSYATSENSVLSVPSGSLANPLANDLDVDGDNIQVSTFMGTSQRGAVVQMDSTGVFTYDPRQVSAFQAMTNGQSMTDTFTYTIADIPGGLSNQRSKATVTITVQGVNDAPTPRPDNYSATPVSEDGTLTISAANGVLGNDSDEENDSFSAVPRINGTSTAGATVTVNPDGSFTYDPRSSDALQRLAVGSQQSDTFTYQLVDSQGNVSGPGTVTVQVVGVNDAPRPMDDNNTNTNGQLAASEDGSVTVTESVLLANDIDDTGDKFSIISIDQSGTQGLVRLFLSIAGTRVTYTANRQFESLKPGQSATDTFTYTVQDQSGAQGTATVTVTVNGVNDAPVAVADNYSVDEDSLLAVPGRGVLFNDTDAENDVLTTIAINKSSQLGAAVSIQQDGTFTYDPTGVSVLQALRPGQTRADTFTYTATDGIAQATGTVTVTVSGRNDAPTAVADQYTASEDATFEASSGVGVLANDFDVDGDSFTAEVARGPANGTLSMAPDGSFSYTPRSNFFGTDTFTYRVSDGNASSTGSVTLNVTNVNDPPTANNDEYEVDQGGTLTVNVANGVLSNDTDPDGDTLTAQRVAGPQSGSLTLDPNGSFVYRPNGNFFGTDSFTYRARDAAGAESTATVTIDVSNIHTWQNPINRFDVNGDGQITPADVLLVINYLNAEGSGPVPVPTPQPPPFRDVNGDDRVTPDDALDVINRINSVATGEGEGEGESARLPSASPAAQTHTGLPATLLVTPYLGSSDSPLSSAKSGDAISLAVDDLFSNDQLRSALNSGEMGPSRSQPASDSDDAELEELLDALAGNLDGDDRDALFGRWA